MPVHWAFIRSLQSHCRLHLLSRAELLLLLLLLLLSLSGQSFPNRNDLTNSSKKTKQQTTTTATATAKLLTFRWLLIVIGFKKSPTTTAKPNCTIRLPGLLKKGARDQKRKSTRTRYGRSSSYCCCCRLCCCWCWRCWWCCWC